MIWLLVAVGIFVVLVLGIALSNFQVSNRFYQRRRRLPPRKARRLTQPSFFASFMGPPDVGDDAPYLGDVDGGGGDGDGGGDGGGGAD
jgi:hypothetical protein